MHRFITFCSLTLFVTISKNVQPSIVTSLSTTLYILAGALGWRILSGWTVCLVLETCSCACVFPCPRKRNEMFNFIREWIRAAGFKMHFLCLCGGLVLYYVKSEYWGWFWNLVIYWKIGVKSDQCGLQMIWKFNTALSIGKMIYWLFLIPINKWIF